jgi:pimeloyl-ACP methyl ester carboxylesterase
VVVGSSIGATFATELALAHPELVGGVVAVDGPAYYPSVGMPLDGLVADLRESRPATVAGWVATWYAPGTSTELVGWTIRQILDSGFYVDGQFTGAAGYDPRPALPGLRVPIHYIHGELDEVPVEVARTCAALTPGAGVTVLPGVAHMPHQERPGRFTSALRAALVAMAPVASA